MLIKKFVDFFDKTEDKIRTKLSHYPILYAFIGGDLMSPFVVNQSQKLPRLGR